MEIVDPGHKYSLNCLDEPYNLKFLLTFVKREGDKYPGNIGSYPGVNLQEVIRACIDRTKYLNNQIPDERNLAIIKNLQRCIWLLEDRAAERHNRGFDYYLDDIELEPTCIKCGHIGCIGH